ncbi:hypothetical protein MuYL_4330 [Mucilaginibacter xinganensis]|uniref:Uncharacterized protein n=1 Tax=Mucilaginibacter xinganensis TaxID=1234841 RepID=A0A223P271_9SPHI|nr:hypothetical protein MuYL_4330 [Mucilaginibacter xinganensis]
MSLKICRYEKENNNNGIAYRCVCRIKYKLCAAKAYETTTGARSALINFTNKPAMEKLPAYLFLPIFGNSQSRG